MRRSFVLVSSGSPGGIKWRREDGVVRPLLRIRREETAAYCRAVGLAPREDSSNRDTKRGLIREEILPLLRRLHPDAEGNLYRLAESRRMPPPLAELLESAAGSRRLDLGSGRVLVREYDQIWIETTPVSLQGQVRWGGWRIESELPGLKV